MNQTPRAGSVNPPARGSFPLDHHGVCKARMRTFLACLELARGAHGECRDASRAYLQCRMEGDLMAPEDLDSLGFASDVRVAPPAAEAAAAEEGAGGERVAGLSAARKGGGFLFGFGGSGAAKRGGGH
jgi:cytochrome c oxidase assembly protein subunit 19